VNNLVFKIVKYSICPNTKCERPFENLIIIDDKSKNPSQKFYGCPNCFFEIDPTVTDSLKKIENMIEMEESINADSLDKIVVDNCPKYFGYLADTIMNSIIPIKCLDCEKLDDCLRSHGKKH
jgi:hypothetical protein